MPFHPSMCCICFEGIEPCDHWRDDTGRRWDVHRGTCAIHAGHVPPEFQPVYDVLVKTIRDSDGETKRTLIRFFYEWAERVAEWEAAR